MRKVWFAKVYNYNRSRWETVGRATSSTRAKEFVMAAMQEDVPADYQYRAHWESDSELCWVDFNFITRDGTRGCFYASVKKRSVGQRDPFTPDRIVTLEVSNAAS